MGVSSYCCSVPSTGVVTGHIQSGGGREEKMLRKTTDRGDKRG